MLVNSILTDFGPAEKLEWGGARVYSFRTHFKIDLVGSATVAAMPWITGSRKKGWNYWAPQLARRRARLARRVHDEDPRRGRLGGPRRRAPPACCSRLMPARRTAPRRSSRRAAMGRRIGVDPEENPAAIYIMRLFGVRTILLGLALLRRNSAVRAEAAAASHTSST